MFETILAILATYRVARMLALEEGAFEVLSKIRERIDAEQKTWIGRGLNCPLCIGFWVAGAFALLLAHQNAAMGRSEFLLAWLAIAGGQAALHLAIER